jgi:hypothetical protein
MTLLKKYFPEALVKQYDLYGIVNVYASKQILIHFVKTIE